MWVIAIAIWAVIIGRFGFDIRFPIVQPLLLSVFAGVWIGEYFRRMKTEEEQAQSKWWLYFWIFFGVINLVMLALDIISPV